MDRILGQTEVVTRRIRREAKRDVKPSPTDEAIGHEATREERQADAALQRQLIDEIKRGNDLLAQLVHVQRDWRIALRQGLMSGLGGVIGATVLVSVLIWLIQPLKRLDVLKPTLDRIAQQLERKTPP